MKEEEAFSKMKTLDENFYKIILKTRLSTTQNIEPSDKDNKKKNIVIICALGEELRAAMRAFGLSPQKVKAIKKEGFGFSFRKIPYGIYDVIFIKSQEMGMIAASSITALAAIAFKPILIAMTGICAGRIKKTELGDLIIAKSTYDYEAGKKHKELHLPRPSIIAIEPSLNDIVDNILIDGDFPTDSLKNQYKEVDFDKFEVHFNSLPSGSRVIADETTLAGVAQHHDDVYGIDMEAYGVAYSAKHLNTPWIVIKGIQDYASPEKNTMEDKYRDFTMSASAALLKHIVDSTYFPALHGGH